MGETCSVGLAHIGTMFGCSTKGYDLATKTIRRCSTPKYDRTISRWIVLADTVVNNKVKCQNNSEYDIHHDPICCHLWIWGTVTSYKHHYLVHCQQCTIIICWSLVALLASKELCVFQGMLLAGELHFSVYLGDSSVMCDSSCFTIEIWRANVSQEPSNKTGIRSKMTGTTDARLWAFQKCIQEASFFLTKVGFGFLLEDAALEVDGL